MHLYTRLGWPFVIRSHITTLYVDKPECVYHAHLDHTAWKLIASLNRLVGSLIAFFWQHHSPIQRDGWNFPSPRRVRDLWAQMPSCEMSHPSVLNFTVNTNVSLFAICRPTCSSCNGPERQWYIRQNSLYIVLTEYNFYPRALFGEFIQIYKKCVDALMFC